MIAGRIVVLAVAVAAAATANAAPGGGFVGTARDVVPTQREIGYKALTGSAPAARPTADKRTGFRSGWQASYLKGTATAPVQAVVLVYVYRTTADATRAYSRSCKTCKEQKVAGIRMKFELRQGGSATTPTVTAVATCRNVYAATVVGGKKTAQALGLEAGSIAGAIFRRAIAHGMSRCASA